jgi:hypothetical protein
MTNPNTNNNLASFHLLQRLRSFVDTRLGVPPQSSRPAPVGPVLVGVKRGFRRAFQPFINDLLDRQTRFNEEMIAWGRALTRDVESVERSLVAMRTGIDLRLSRLEAIVERLEKLQNQKQQEDTSSAESKRPVRSKNAHDKS